MLDSNYLRRNLDFWIKLFSLYLSVMRLETASTAVCVCKVFNSWNISHRIKAHSEQMVPKSHVFKLYKCQKRCLILAGGISKEDRKKLATQGTKLTAVSVWNGIIKVAKFVKLGVAWNLKRLFYLPSLENFLVFYENFRCNLKKIFLIFDNELSFTRVVLGVTLV